MLDFEVKLKMIMLIEMLPGFEVTIAQFWKTLKMIFKFYPISNKPLPSSEKKTLKIEFYKKISRVEVTLYLFCSKDGDFEILSHFNTHCPFLK